MPYSSDMAVIQFENENELRKYPFSFSSSLADRFGRELPYDFISDVHLFVPLGHDDDGSSSGSSDPEPHGAVMPSVRLVSAHVSQHMVSVCFRSEAGGVSDALSVSVRREDFVPYFPYRMEPLLFSSGIGGFVSFGNLEFPGFPETYILENAEIDPCCVSSSERVRTKRFVDSRSGESVSGEVELSFPDHVYAKKDGDSYRLLLDSGSEDALMSECVKAGGVESCGATPILSINGVRPDDSGNIVIWFH